MYLAGGMEFTDLHYTFTLQFTLPVLGIMTSKGVTGRKKNPQSLINYKTVKVNYQQEFCANSQEYQELLESVIRLDMF